MTWLRLQLVKMLRIQLYIHISVFHNLIRKIFKLIFFLMLTFNWHLLPENQTNRNFFFIKNVQNVKKSFTSYTVAYMTKAWIYWAVEPETPVSCGAWDTCELWSLRHLFSSSPAKKNVFGSTTLDRKLQKTCVRRLTV